MNIFYNHGLYSVCAKLISFTPAKKKFKQVAIISDFDVKLTIFYLI